LIRLTTSKTISPRFATMRVPEEIPAENEDNGVYFPLVTPEVLTVVLSTRVLDVIVFTSNFYDLLGHLGRPVRYVAWDNFDSANSDTWKFVNNSLVVAFGTTILGVESEAYMRHISALGATNMGVFHMADELCEMPTNYYTQASYVMRNYYCPKTFARFPSLLWIPNGWADQVGPRDSASLLPSSMRKTLCSFSGRPTSERQKFAQILTTQGITCTSTFSTGFGGGKSRPLYALELADAKFAPCPAGNSPETIRFYDALENGAIPVLVECDFTRYLFPNRDGEPLPAIILSSWNDFAATLQPYLEDEGLLNELQRRAIGWWQQQKQITRHQAAGLIDKSFLTPKTLDDTQHRKETL